MTSTEPGLPASPLLASDLDLLTEALRPRAVELRRYLSWARNHQADPATRIEVAEQLSLALSAAFAGDHAAAETCIGYAELALGPWRTERAARAVEAEAAQQAVAAGAAERRLRKLRAAATAEGGSGAMTDTIAVITGGLSGAVPVTSPGPYLVIATDGSYAGKYYGFAYVASDGRWGVRGGHGGADPCGSLIAELAAAGMGAACVRRAVGGVLAVDSRVALGWLARWRSGCWDLPPVDGGDADAPSASAKRRQGWLSAAAGEVRRRPYMEAVHVPGHRGHHLNEAADILAKLARRWRSGEDQASPEQMLARIEAQCTAFLRSWHGA